MEELPSPNQEYIDVGGTPRVGWRWVPQQGPETLRLLQRLALPEDSAQVVLNEAADALARGISPTASQGEATGLVLGYVQSGKTLSFTTVATLARDNGFRVVIVVAGTSVPLFYQSCERLREDLQLDGPGVRNRWRVFQNPTLSAARQPVEAVLRRWLDPDVPASQRATVLIEVMKDYRHLANLNELLEHLPRALRDGPILVIDDEADQAGLNTRTRSGDQSTTYQRLLTLRSLFPHRTYLQYTATPQAPLLISLIDQLSPDYACVLTPGADYTGGKTFFGNGRDLLRPIPASDISPAGEYIGVDPPSTYLAALRLFLVEVAVGLIQEDPGNRSMLSHPSPRTTDHALFTQWTNQAITQWRSTLQASAQDPDRLELIREFRYAYDDLARTVDELPEWENVVAALRRACGETIVVEVNARRGPTPQVDYDQDYAQIIVGGQALDRGVTVKGLTITYMPRSPGGGYADAIQQRARFFGYKHRYLGYCRLFLAPDTLAAYIRYVEHEEHMREQLRAFQQTGRPLQEWKRAFFLDLNLRPTRTNVLSLDYMQGRTRDWTETPSSHAVPEALQHNQALVNALVSQYPFTDYPGHPRRTPDQRHCVTEVPLGPVFRDLLLSWRLARLVPEYVGLLLGLEEYLSDNPDAKCHVYLMGGGRVRVRSAVRATGNVRQLYQGAYPTTDRNIYPGDRNIRQPNQVSIQVHTLNLREGTTGTVFFATDVPVLAIWVPPSIHREWLVGHVPSP